MASDTVRAFVRDVAKGLELIADAAEREVNDRDGRIARLTADLDAARELLREVAGAACTVKLDGATDWSLKQLYDVAAKAAAFLERKP